MEKDLELFFNFFLLLLGLNDLFEQKINEETPSQQSCMDEDKWMRMF